MPHAKSSLHWSVIHYKGTFERHSGHGSETPTEALVNKMAVLKTLGPQIRVPN